MNSLQKSEKLHNKFQIKTRNKTSKVNIKGRQLSEIPISLPPIVQIRT